MHNSNNGLITKIWGSAGWTFNHSITFGYPVNPTEADKIKYRNYFISVGDVLPCRFCRESYQKFITNGPTALTDEVLTNRASLTKWFYDIHEAVNAKLEINYGITYEDVVDRYESFRAKCGKTDPAVKGCVAPLDYKAFSFKKLYNLDAPIIELDIVKSFINLAKERGLDERWFGLVKIAEQANGNYQLLKHEDFWFDRNKFCQHQIRYMRENAIPSIEPIDSEFAGTPTIDELKLLLFLSSNLCHTELIKALHAVEKRSMTRIKEKSISQLRNRLY